MISESQTRKEIIDKKLQVAGWNLSDRSQVVEEYDIEIGLPEGVKEPVTPYQGHQYCDYVLLGKNGKPLAVVEAKKTSKDAAVGREQAKQYCQHIRDTLGYELPFCFYTNGHDIFFWDIGNYPPRKVFGFPTRDDLERFRYIQKSRKSLAEELINTRIVGRDYQIQAIRAVLEGVEKKRRKFLLVMATGTGKTRTCIALVDALMKGGWAERVLFLVDRIALRDQTLGEFKIHLPNEPRWPKEGEYTISKDRRIYVSTSLIDKLWNNFWSGGISNPLTAIEQITYLIFMKRLDDIEAKRERDAEFTGEKYDSRFKGKFKVPGSEEKVDKNDLRWSTFKHWHADKMLLHIQTKVFPFLKTLNSDLSPFTKAMENAVFIMPKSSLLVEAINIIEEIFTEIEKDATKGGQAFQDIQGDVYEMLLSEIATAGKNGQFRTPRHIIKLMAELVAPQLGERIADPACGTSGFLLGAYQYILTDQVRKKNPKKLVKDEDGFERGTMSAAINEKVKKILNDSIYGFDIDTTMVRLGAMNLMMHGIDNPHIHYKDTLSKSFNEERLYHTILANPPFTGNIDKGDINESLKLPTTKTELLFTELIFNMLKMGGTAAVIVPQGVLFGSGKAFVIARKKIVEESELKAVITLPSGVFRPYAGVSTSILIFTKGGETRHTWFYDLQSDGYSLDDKRNKLEGCGDLQDVIERYKKRDVKKDKDRTQKYFFIPKKEMVDNEYDLSLSKYKEEVHEEVSYEKPKTILNRLLKTEKGIELQLQELHKLI